MNDISTFTLKDIPDLLCDSYIVDSNDNLVFLSVWGRDTAMQELLAKLTIGSSSNVGLTDIRLVNRLNLLFHAKLTNDSEYNKKTQKFYHSQFGTLNHAWIFDKRIKQPCRENQSAMLMFEENTSPDMNNMSIFQTIKQLTSIPLLDHWQTSVIEIAKDNDMIKANLVLGRPIQSFTINLNENIMVDKVSELIQNKTLTL
ncbi:hypothetical protein RHO12_01970 [Orbus sturtevantii]|uniref:hypothetical protein n=1 Tax=Orbus sturtevantii TaxID=3074109 RepID=UPI00370D9725